MNVDTSPTRADRGATGAGRGRRALPVLRSPAECCVPLDATDMSTDDAEATATVFKALADPSRVRIVNLLASAGEPVCVCDLNARLPLSQPTVSFHLKKLADAGILEREQRGVWAFYSIDRRALGRLATVFRLRGGDTRDGTSGDTDGTSGDTDGTSGDTDGTSGDTREGTR